jgi:predicted ribosome-associated RNA-binding protein Tma20
MERVGLRCVKFVFEYGPHVFCVGIVDLNADKRNRDIVVVFSFEACGCAVGCQYASIPYM